ncbi:hypothetical protein HHX47_DHR8000308 [Lentinula edodes]|nr:hypothetical protein HHX47_DHR8000308 [Lentinula edodes]
MSMRFFEFDADNDGEAGLPLQHLTSDTFSLDVFNKLMKTLQPQMERLVKDEISLPLWEPEFYFDSESVTVPERHKRFIHDLKIPRACAPHDDLPDMLSYELGRFQTDKHLQQRLRGLFGSNTHKIYVNTSGSGKTRTVLEHLCSTWGFYFTCDPDPHVGSKDIASAFSDIRDDKVTLKNSLPHAPSLLVTPKDINTFVKTQQPFFGIDKQSSSSLQRLRREVLLERISQFKLDSPRNDQFRKALESNQELAGSELLVPLLARLLVFRQYLSTMARLVPKSDHDQMSFKRKWLHLQLHPDLLDEGGGEDLFASLTSSLQSLFAGETETLHISKKVQFFRTYSELVLAEIERILGPKNPLHIVIDECQFLTTDIEDSFRSTDWTAKRGILRELARWWDKVLNRSKERKRKIVGLAGCFIFTGTGLSRDLVYDVLSSVVVKPTYCVDVYDTGAFDNPTSQVQYLKRFFPPEVWYTAEAKHLQRRVFFWLRGRFTAEFVSLVLQCGYQSMHEILNQYINNMAGFLPADCGGSEVDFQGIVRFPGLAFGFDRLNEQMKEKIKTVAHGYLLTSKIDTVFGEDETEYIEYGLARILSKQGRKSIRIDEPLVLLSCSIWFNHQPAHTLYKTVTDNIQDHNPSAGRNGFEEFIALYLLNVFQTPTQLKNVFDFSGVAGKLNDQGLENKLATLVTLHLDDNAGSSELVEGKICLFGDPRLSGPIGLGIASNGNPVLNDWLNLKRHTAFCFPMNAMGPDILCFLKLEDMANSDFTYVCLAIQCKFHRAEKDLAPLTLRKAVATITPEEFFERRKTSDTTTNRMSTLASLKALPHRDPHAGKYGVIRIVCGFPVKVDLSKPSFSTEELANGQGRRVKAEDPSGNDSHPVAKLKIETLIETTRHEHLKNILRVIEQKAIEARDAGHGAYDENDPAILLPGVHEVREVMPIGMDDLIFTERIFMNSVQDDYGQKGFSTGLKRGYEE